MSSTWCPPARRASRVACLWLAAVATAHGKAVKLASPIAPPLATTTSARTASAFAENAPRAARPEPATVADGPRMPRLDERIACPVPEEGIEHAVQLMREGLLFRYTFPSGTESPVTTCENALAAYTGHKYCIAVNSGASALYLSLRAAGVEPGKKVLCNAFTFGAVPSAIVHAGCEVVYVESSDDYCIDVSAHFSYFPSQSPHSSAPAPRVCSHLKPDRREGALARHGAQARTRELQRDSSAHPLRGARAPLALPPLTHRWTIFARRCKSTRMQAPSCSRTCAAASARWTRSAPSAPRRALPC